MRWLRSKVIQYLEGLSPSPPKLVAEIMVDEVTLANGRMAFVANIALSDETVRAMTTYPSRREAKAAAVEWVRRVGAVAK